MTNLNSELQKPDWTRSFLNWFAMEELLANPLKAKLVAEPDKTEWVNFLNEDEKKSIGKNEGALLTLLVEARRRKWSNARLIEYLDTYLELDIDKETEQANDGDDKGTCNIDIHYIRLLRKFLIHNATCVT